MRGLEGVKKIEWDRKKESEILIAWLSDPCCPAYSVGGWCCVYVCVCVCVCVCNAYWEGESAWYISVHRNLQRLVFCQHVAMIKVKENWDVRVSSAILVRSPGRNIFCPEKANRRGAKRYGWVVVLDTNVSWSDRAETKMMRQPADYKEFEKNRWEISTPRRPVIKYVNFFKETQLWELKQN